MQNVIVLGGAYGGVHAARLLASGLGANFRVILIDRNSHVNHLYVIPRFGVLPGHEHKCFVPYTGVYTPIQSDPSAPPPAPSSDRHLVLHAQVISLASHSVTLDRSFPALGLGRTIPFTYAVYALGSKLPAPIDLWAREDVENSVVAQPGAASPEERRAAEEAIDEALEATVEEATRDIRNDDLEKMEEGTSGYRGTKKEGMEWLRRCQERIRGAGSVLCVGGGALGIQFATDIKSLYPEKEVTLLHSRHRLLPRFDYDLHCEVLKTLEELNVELILGERLDLETAKPENMKMNTRGQRVVRTVKGREVAADLLLLCTGQVPNTEFISEMSPGSVDPVTKLAYVLPTMQLGVIPPIPSTVEGESATEAANSILAAVDKLELSSESRLEEQGDDQEEEEGAGAEELEALPDTPYPHIFVVGDSADAFGAIKAGHTAYWQAGVAARNLMRLASVEELEEGSEGGQGGSLELESYTPGLPAIKVSLGIGKISAYQINGVVGRKDAVDADDLDAPGVWSFFGMPNVSGDGLYA